MTEFKNNTNWKLLGAGIGIMLLAVLVLIFIDTIHLKEGIGIGLLFIIGFGLTVAGSPDEVKRGNDAGSM